MTLATVLGYPRIGRARELKTIEEAFWKGQATEAELLEKAASLRATHWQVQRDAGMDVVACGDFSFYDLMLDMAMHVGAMPQRYAKLGKPDSLAAYFAMARGAQRDGVDVPALEMTKWFDTNYHYLVPEFSQEQSFALSTEKPVAQYLEAVALGLTARPVLIGPISFLRLGKIEGGGDPLSLLDRLLPVYAQSLQALEKAGATWVQIDEPLLVLDLDDAARSAYQRAFADLRKASGLKILLATYFGDLRENMPVALGLPIDALHLDLVRAPRQLDAALKDAPASLSLSLGVVDGRNIWRADLRAALALLNKAKALIGAERIWVSASCSLLHTPYDLDGETALDAELKNWMAFAKQKLQEIALLKTGLVQGEAAIAAALTASDTAQALRAASPRLHDAEVALRLSRQPLVSAGRAAPFTERQPVQAAALGLPLFPTTTIGSFPQTKAVRHQRAAAKGGKIDAATYEAFLREQTIDAIREQEKLGIDVLVHGEFERNDMVEYFGEQLSGFAFTKNGWVQSYGSRCVKPPVIFGDVARPEPMTVGWSQFAQAQTEKHVKGMLTGPVTILQWSFARNDIPRSTIAHQIALALQDEVLDLEKAGIRIIQIDEPAFREGLPLRQGDWAAYLEWAGQAFRLASTGVANSTQIHTHMCYCEFNDIMDSIQQLDADVISIETSRSRMELLDAFTEHQYPNEIGPGVYDIHSPRVPSVEEMVNLLEKAQKHLRVEQIWVNPDCGLKTRDWPEVKAALEAMVSAARTLRERAAKKVA